MKRSGSLPYAVQGEKVTGNDSEKARITRDADGTVWRDQSKCIQHCLQESGFFGADGSVSLKKTTTLPSIDEKLGEEAGSLKE